ncbi:MAG TPA: hypothetical protein PLW44_17770 [Chitinophagales bacterium]|nr:hypothetical protein [Chitinophagales bacterium]
MIHSRFTAFFILTRTLMAIVPIAFIIAPIGVYFANVKGFEDQSSLPSLIIMATVMWPMVYLFIREYDIITIKLAPEGIQAADIIKRKKRTYQYNQVERTAIEIRRTIGYNGRHGNIRDINDNPVFIIYMQNGDSVTMASDVYSNSEEMYNFINDRTTALAQD